MTVAGPQQLDGFDPLTGWEAVASAGVYARISPDTGHTGLGMRIDFDFRDGPGFLVVRKAFALSLPENYRFRFYVRGEAPVNDVEFKLVDASGRYVFWHRKRRCTFPDNWRPVTIRKRDEPASEAEGRTMSELGAIELALAGGSTGKGSIWIDDLTLEPMEPAGHLEMPEVRASTALPGHLPEAMFDRDLGAIWKSEALPQAQSLTLVFRTDTEYGGVRIEWDEMDYACDYRVEGSDDGRYWAGLHAVTAGAGGRDYVPIAGGGSRHLRLRLLRSSRGKGYGIRNMTVLPYEFSTSPERMFETIAQDAPRGCYPRYLYGEQTYWTVVGVGDGKEERQALLNEEGTLEVERGGFSIEPFLHLDGRLLTWNEAELRQGLERGNLPIPAVVRRYAGLGLAITVLAAGDGVIYSRYRVENSTTERRALRLFLAVRPFEVNPPWQSLNMADGTASIHALRFEGRTLWVNGDRAVVSLTVPDRLGAAAFHQGLLADHLLTGALPDRTEVSDPLGHASAAFEYRLAVPPGGVQEVYLAIPARGGDRMPAEGEPGPIWEQRFDEVARSWEARLGRVAIHLPPSLDHLTDTAKSTLAYILINRDGHALRPGTRCYARSWIRDGALIAAALLQMGHAEEVRDFILWYGPYQSESGKIPCCVDGRGPDPTPEHDSDGEFVYLVMEYHRYTQDRVLLEALWPRVQKAIAHIEALRRERMTAAYRMPDKLGCYGLMPESISHEGYSGNPVHSYWDDFWTLRGLKDAADMATILGHEAEARRLSELRDDFRTDLYASFARTMARHGIAYLPGSVELGDFDPTSTAIALDPCGEQDHLPEAALARTFADYEALLEKRRQGEAWDSYTPYELRNVGALMRLGRRDQALTALEFFLNHRRPADWNHWAEVVWRDPRTPRFIGDMPHTWVGSEYLRALRSLFVYERESDRALVIAAGLPRAWLTAGVSVHALPTYYGLLSYRLEIEGSGALRLSLSGALQIPPGGIILEPPLAAPLSHVTVNGADCRTFSAGGARITSVPAEVVLEEETGYPAPTSA